MSRAWVVLIGVAAVATSCKSLRIRGGDTVPAGAEPKGKVLGSYVPTDCKDAKGTAVPGASSSRLFYVEVRGGRRLLVDAKRGHDSIVIDNSFVDAAEHVFQVILKNRDGRMMLRDYRVPRDAGPTGRMAVAQRWKESSTKEGSFRGDFDAPLMTCSLDGTGGKPQAAEPPPPPPPTSEPASPPPPRVGAPEPQESYAVGDIVAVDDNGTERRGKVLQALEGRYFVEYERPGGPTEWIDKSKIKGKIP